MYQLSRVIDRANLHTEITSSSPQLTVELFSDVPRSFRVNLADQKTPLVLFLRYLPMEGDYPEKALDLQVSGSFTNEEPSSGEREQLLSRPSRVVIRQANLAPGDTFTHKFYYLSLESRTGNKLEI